MPIEASELSAFIEAADAAEGPGVPAEHAEWHFRYMQRLAQEMSARGLITAEAQALAARDLEKNRS